MTAPSDSPIFLHRDRFDPAQDLARLSQEAPVARVELPHPGLYGEIAAWLVLGYKEVRKVMLDTKSFSNFPRMAALQAAAAPRKFPSAGHIVAFDPPEHTRLRKILNPAFTIKHLQKWIPRIQDIVHANLDRMEEIGPPVDLVQEFAYPLPALMLCELLGVPYADRSDFMQRNHVRSGDLSAPMDQLVAVYFDSLEYMAGIVARQRADPGDSLLGWLIREYGGELTDEELTGLCDLLLVAGQESTSNMIAAGIAALLHHSDQMAMLRDHPEMTEGAVEELLRYITIFHLVDPRRATHDVVVAGQQIKAGDLVLLGLPTANRDGALGPGMNRLDITRPPAPHLAFGHGIHHCIGAPLARLEMRVAFPELLARFPSLRFATSFEDLEFRDNSFAYGVRALMVTW